MAPATTNFTVEVPQGTTNHNDPSLICTPATRSDVFVFFVTNYFIHAASLPAVPGESIVEIAFSALNALFIPGFGAGRAIRRLVLRPGFKHRRSPLECAARAGALCMVVHKDIPNQFKTRQREKPDDWYSRVFKIDQSPRGMIIPLSRTIHGVCKLPDTDNYRLLVVPHNAPLRPLSAVTTMHAIPACPASDTPEKDTPDDGDTPDQDIPDQDTPDEVTEQTPMTASTTTITTTLVKTPFRLANEYNVAKVLFSLVQAVAGSITIYRARGDQIARYGISAFGLSVVPYVFMSMINIVASFLAPDYPNMYLIRTPDMARAEKEGGEFDGVVAELDVPPEPQEGTVNNDLLSERFFLSTATWLLLVAAPLIIVGVVSQGFPQGDESTPAQRGWIMSWLVIGSVSSLWSLAMKKTVWSAFYSDQTKRQEQELSTIFGYGGLVVVLIVPFCIPAIGGMVVVARQLREYGMCQRFH